MGITAKEQLNRQKLEAEIRKLGLEADLLELKVTQETKDMLETTTSEYANRIYTFSDIVTKETVEECIATLGHWARRETAPISVVFNSPGGGVLHGLALYDFLRVLSGRGNQITTVALGRTASMGGVLMQAGDIRQIGAQSYFHIHEVSAGTIGKIGEMEDDVDFSKRLWQQCVEILASRSKLTITQVKKKAERREWWLNATEALELRFVDEILV